MLLIIKKKKMKKLFILQVFLWNYLLLFLRVANKNSKDNSQYKITLNTNKSQMTIQEIFKDLTNIILILNC